MVVLLKTRLDDRWAEVLASQPETGMGYQVVSMRLKDGRRIENVTIVGGYVSDLPDSTGRDFCSDDIEEIVVTHGKARP